MAQTETVRDEFTTQDYSRNDGTTNWSTNWKEKDDRIRRKVDLTGASTAILSFNWESVGLDDDEFLDVQVGKDGGSFTSIGTFSGTESGYFYFDISAYVSSDTRIRFRNTSSNWGNNEIVYIDNVQVSYVVLTLSDPCAIGPDPIWSENFEGVNQGWTSIPSAWKNSHSTAVFNVANLPSGGEGFVGSYLDAQYGNPQQFGVWMSNKISISNYSDIKCSIDLGSWGNEMENADYLRVYYSVDGGPDVLFSVNGSHQNDIATQTACANIPDGDEVTLKVVMRNTYPNEHYYIDNIVVSGELNTIGNPPVAKCKDITVELDASGNAIISVDDINDGSSDEETDVADLILSLDKTSFDCDDIGVQIVILTVEDGDGNVSNCSANVIVEDKVAPSLLNLNAEYYIGRDFSESKYSESVNEINFDWGEGFPNTSLVGENQFSIRYSGSFVVPKGGDYTFYTSSDDGVLLYIDGSLVIDDWEFHAIKENSAIVNLTAGEHTIRLEYFEGNGEAVIQLEWESVDVGMLRQVFSKSSILSNSSIEVTLKLNASGSATLLAADIDPGFIDNCGVTSQTLSQSSFTTSDVGVKTVVLTVKDASENITNVNVRVIVEPADPSVSLSISTNSIDENGGTASITASIISVQSVPITVNLTYSGVNPSNYSAVNQIVIPAGATSTNINFSALDNFLEDGDRDVLIEINSVVNGVENGTQEETITIVDDEEPSQITIPFQQRTSQYTPEKKIYNIKGDFTMIGNTNLTLSTYSDTRSNSNNQMKYVDVDSDASTFNSSSATLSFSEENGAKPQCSNIVYAGLYWTGRGYNSNYYDFQVWDGSEYLDKREIRIKHADGSGYQEITARDEDVYYPDGSESDIYAAYAEVTDYVQTHGIGEYFVADMALSEGDGGNTGYCGGWGLVVVYENSKMKWRDVTLYDGYAYVSREGAEGTITSYDFPISGFKAVQSGDVNIKLGLMASEGDVGIPGDFMQIENAAQNQWTSLSHGGNETDNFFNSSIETGGNSKNPDLINNTGVDVSMFEVPNVGNLNIANGQTRTKFRYGTSQDAYAIFALAMAVDAYVPEAEATNAVMTIDGNPIVDGSIVEPGQEIVYQLDIRNRGTEAVNDAQLILPIPYTTEYVSSSADVFFSPAVNNVYYDITEGATGSIVWDLGDLPISPDGPDQILGTLTYTVKVTEDCTILGNPNCDPSVAVGGGGGSSGTGATSGTTISGFSIIQGYETSGECIGEPIVTPIEIQIDAEDFVTTNCNIGEIESGQEYFFCNLGALASIPISEVSGNFPTGCRFYADYPVVEGITEEYTVSNEFLADEGTKTYYAVPPGYTTCYYTFKITVKNINSLPTASDVIYCENDLAIELEASASDTAYELFYYTVATDGIAQMSIFPPTNIVGETTYYVAEGESASCMSPNRTPFVVKVNPKPKPIGIFFD